MKRMIKSLWVALATLSALLAVVSCVKALAVKEQAVNFDSSLTTEQSQIVKGDSTVTTQLLINEEEVDCPRPTKYSVSFTYDEEAGTLFFLGDSIQSGKPISLSSLSDLVLTYQAKKLVGNKVDVTVSNDAPKKLSKELVWNVLADKAYWVKSEQEGDGEVTITGCDDLDAVKPDTKLAVTSKPADGWKLVALTANDVDILEDKSFVVTSNTVVKVVFKKLPPIPDVPTPDHIPNEYDYQRNCSIKILMVDQDTVKLPIPVKQYKEYLNIEAVHVKENEIYRRVKFDFSEVALSEQSEGLFRCDFFYIDWSRVIRPFLQVQQKQPLRDYIFSHATVNAVGKAIDGTFRKDKIETLASSDPILASIPELAGSYVLTQLPLAHCSNHTNPLENYLEVICFFKHK